jgi:hypothetical protein
MLSDQTIRSSVTQPRLVYGVMLEVVLYPRRAVSTPKFPSIDDPGDVFHGGPCNSNIDLQVSRGGGLYMHINRPTVDDRDGTIVMAELAPLRGEFPGARIDVQLSAQRR